MSLERFCPLYIDQAFTGTFREDCPVDGQLTEINGDHFAVPPPPYGFHRALGIVLL